GTAGGFGGRSFLSSQPSSATGSRIAARTAPLREAAAADPVRRRGRQTMVDSCRISGPGARGSGKLLPHAPKGTSYLPECDPPIDDDGKSIGRNYAARARRRRRSSAAASKPAAARPDGSGV